MSGTTEENRLMRSLDAELEGDDDSEEGEGGGAELDDDSITRFVYNDQGERVMKRGDENETAYINAFYVVRAGDDDDLEDGFHSKHIFIGNSRIISKIVPHDDEDFGDNDWKDCPTRDTQFPRILPEDCLIQVYHPDHLGSTSHLTDRNGQQLEHNLYFPFGESWVSQHRNDDDDGMRGTAYKFTSKELDSETGLYYFGARYYDPRTSLWISADPILGEYLGNDPNKLRGMGGIFNPSNIGLYSYTYNNPINYIDPDGRTGEFVAFWGVWATATADAVIPEPSDAAAPVKVPIYLAALAGTAIGGTLMYLKNAVFNEEAEDNESSASGTKPNTGNEELDDILSDSENSDGGEKGFTYPGSQEELIEEVKDIEGAKHATRPGGTTTTILPDGTKVDTYPGRTSTGKPGWQVTKPGSHKPSVKGDTLE